MTITDDDKDDVDGDNYSDKKKLKKKDKKRKKDKKKKSSKEKDIKKDSSEYKTLSEEDVLEIARFKEAVQGSKQKQSTLSNEGESK